MITTMTLTRTFVKLIDILANLCECFNYDCIVAQGNESLLFAESSIDCEWIFHFCLLVFICICVFIPPFRDWAVSIEDLKLSSCSYSHSGNFRCMRWKTVENLYHINLTIWLRENSRTSFNLQKLTVSTFQRSSHDFGFHRQTFFNPLKRPW